MAGYRVPQNAGALKLRDVIDRKVVAWAVYDWANSAFALSIMAVLYPLFLGSYWSAGAAGSSVTARLAWVTAGANAVVSILAPIFGTIADAGGYRKRFLVGLAMIGAAGTMSLAFVGEGNWTARDVSDALAARDRAQAGPTAPPQGLYLVRVFFTASDT